MEAKKTNGETVNDTAKISEKWLSATTEAMMDVYNKQIQFTAKLYDNFINSFSGNNRNFGEQKNVPNMFLNSDLAKWPGLSFKTIENNYNPFFPSIDDVYKKMLEYNRNFLESLKNIKDNQIDWSAVNTEYFKTIESQLEASKKIGNSLNESYNTKKDFFIESNKKLMEEVNIQLGSLINQNQKIVTEFFNTQKTSHKEQPSTGAEEKKNKEANTAEPKKKWEAPVSN